jgi:hypothetical protein
MIETLLHQQSFADYNPLALLFSPLYIIAILVGCVIVGYPLYIAAQRANHATPWFGFIPILNLILLCQLGGLEMWWIILCFVPCVNIAAIIYIWWKFAESMGKPGPVGIAMIIPCVNIFIPYYIVFM